LKHSDSDVSDVCRTARKRMDLASWLMAQQVQWTCGSAREEGQFLSV